jgi:hypothetical protein
MNKEELQEILFENIKLKLFHEHYQRVCDLAVLYSQVISGKDIDKLLKQFVRREDTTMFEQRVKITQQITPAICSKVIKSFKKIFRTKPAKEYIDFENDSETKVEEIKEAIANIYGRKDIYKYLQDKFMYLTFCDPNAFILTTFDEFDAKTEKPTPYNLEITSSAAVNYKYFNNILQWMISRIDIKYLEQDHERDGFIWTIYGPEYTYVMTQVGSDYVAQDGEIIQEIIIDEESKKSEFFIFEEHNHKSKVIPVIQVGYERDLQTEGETFVSPIQPGMPYLMKSIKTVSEFDLTMALHAFPQKFMFEDRCTFTAGVCDTSKLHQDRCTMCNKSGIKVHSSAQDAVVLKLPKDAEDVFDLSKLVHYEHPPIEILEFQDKTIDKYALDFNKAVFNSNTFTKDQIAKTATGEGIDMDHIYDTYKPCAEKISDVWEHAVTVTSYYLDFPDPIVDHAYPDDFKQKGIAILIGELNAANTGGASGYITSGLEDDIMRQMYIDNPLEFQKYQAKQKLYPFKGKAREEVQAIIMSGVVRESDVILFNYFETIFSELEEEYDEKDLWFYDLSPKKQRIEVMRKVAQIKKEIDENKAIALELEADVIVS